MDNLTERIESIIKQSEEQIMDKFNRVLEIVGDKPLGFTEGDTLEQLDNYLVMRDDQELWTQWIQEEAQTVGLDAAKVLAVNEATRLERLLSNIGGPNEVRRRMLERHVKENQKILNREPKPLEEQYTIVEEDPMADDLSLLQSIMTGG